MSSATGGVIHQVHLFVNFTVSALNGSGRICDPKTLPENIQRLELEWVRWIEGRNERRGESGPYDSPVRATGNLDGGKTEMVGLNG